ncbi:MAG TPA: MFS transporter [Vicinamibacterales bacterium]
MQRDPRSTPARDAASPESPATSRTDAARPLLVLSVIFLITGLITATLGPALPDLAARTGRSLAVLGRVFTAIFAGSLAVQLLAGYASDRFGRGILLVLGLTAFAAGTLGVALSRALPLTLAAGTLLGIGFGTVTLSVNVLASEALPHRRASAVNLVNVFYGIGSIAGPLLAAVFLERAGSAVGALLLGTALLLATVPLSVGGLPAGAAKRTARTSHAAPAAGTRGFILTCGTFLLVYVGLEWAIGAWTAVYLQRSIALDPAGAATATSVFWFSLSAGRALAVVAGMNVTAERLLTASMAGSFTGALILWLGHGTGWASLAALGILGLSFGPVYPTGIAIVTGRFPESAGTATSRIGVLGALGGMAFPWLYGIVLTRGTPLDAARLTLIVVAVMVVLWWRMYRLEQQVLHERGA